MCRKPIVSALPPLHGQGESFQRAIFALPQRSDPKKLSTTCHFVVADAVHVMTNDEFADDYIARVRGNELTSVYLRDGDDIGIENAARVGETLYETRMASTIVHMDIAIEYLMASTPLSAQQQEQGTSLRTLRNGVYYPMIEYLRTTPKLTRFSLDCDPDVLWTRWSRDSEACDLACQLIPEALYNNQSITDLSLDHFDQHSPESFPLRDAIFTALARRRRQLDKLCLYYSTEQLSESTEFAAYVQSCALNELKLSCGYSIIDLELCNLLFVAHRGRIKRIVFDRCDVSPDAAHPFASCLQQQNACNRNNKTMLDLFVICKEPDHGLDSQALGAFFIPSQGFVRVYNLDMSLGAFRHLPVLTFHLPASLHVRWLRLRLVESMDESDDEDEDFGTPAEMFHVFGTPAQMFHNNPDLRRRQLLDALRRNGSVHSAEVKEVHVRTGPFGQNRYENFFTPAQERMVEAWTTRNKELPKLLSRPRVDTGGNNDDNEGTTDLELFPPLFVAGTEAASMAPNNVLLGLISARQHGI